MDKKTDLYELQDILKLFGSKANIALALKIHPSQVTRWGARIPDAPQIALMRVMDQDHTIKREYFRIKRARLHVERQKRKEAIRDNVQSG